LDEAIALSNHFKIGLGDISIKSSEAVSFSRSSYRGRTDDFQTYLDKSNKKWQEYAKLKDVRGIIAAKDIPLYYFFQFPELGQFKIFLWLKTIKSARMTGSEGENRELDMNKFDFGIIPDKFYKTCFITSDVYFHIPFIEIWTMETVTSTINEINYFEEAGWFASKNIKQKLLQKLEELIQVIQRQAETGVKWINDTKLLPEISYDLYFNELMSVDNTILIITKDFQTTIINYNTLDYLYTFHPKFGEELKQAFEIQIRKSQQLSRSSEKERNKFFNQIYKRIGENRGSVN
jgi:hypothetical protein